MYINGLLQELKQCKVGIKLHDRLVTVLAYADDIVLMAQTQAGLQTLLNCLENWCRKWKLKVNLTKTRIMHMRQAGVKETTYGYQYDGKLLDQANSY